MKTLHTIHLGIIPLLVGLGAFPVCQAFEWKGSAGPDFRSPASWTGKPPAVNSANAGNIRLNGQPTTPDKFRFVNLPPQGIYILAAP